MGGQAKATATSLSTGGGNTQADANASGASGFADASATTIQATDLIRTVMSSTSSSIVGVAAVHAQSSIGGTAPIANTYDGLQAVSYSVALPQRADMDTFLAKSPTVQSNFDVGGKSDVLGLGLLSAQSDGTQNSVSASNRFQFDTTQMPNSLQHLLVGFTGLLANGSLSTTGSLALEIDVNKVSVFSENFTNLITAQTTLSDKTLDLGAWSSLTSVSGSLLDLQMSLVLNTTSAASFSTNLIIGNSTWKRCISCSCAVYSFAVRFWITWVDWSCSQTQNHLINLYLQCKRPFFPS